MALYSHGLHSHGLCWYGRYKGAEIFKGRSQLTQTKGWLAATCPQTLIMTLGDVLESGDASSRVNPAFLCATCGVLYILRGEYTHAYTVRCAGVHAQKCESKDFKFMAHGPLGSLYALQCTNPAGEYPFLFLIKLG